MSGCRGLGEVLDELDQFVGLVALAACVGQERLRAFDDGALLGCPGHGDAAASAERLEKVVKKLRSGMSADTGVGGAANRKA